MSNNQELLQQLNQLIQKEWVKNPEIENILESLKNTLEGDNLWMDQKDLILLPMNPLIKEAKDLWGAEMVAFGYNVLGTMFVNAFTQNTAALALAWPVIEKIWFVIREYGKAIIDHRKTWKPIPQWFKENLSNGLKNLIVDILVHDSIYTSIMAYGISNNILDAWILSIFSFFIALPPAILMKYSGNELLYYIQKNYTKLHGFEREKYYEARFILNNHHDPEDILTSIAKDFWLFNYNLSTYHDQYFDHTIPAFSDRMGTLKLRKITDSATGNTASNLEIAHTLATKWALDKNNIFNFFYSSKEKWKKDISTINQEQLLKKFPYKHIIKNPSKEIIFDRQIFYDKELRITLDKIITPTNDQLKSVMELKVYKDTKYLMEAMQSIMKWGNVRVTTHGKNQLL